MAGQHYHFTHQTSSASDYTKARYREQTIKLFNTVERELATRDFIGATYSIADMAIYSWLQIYSQLKMNINDFPNIASYLQRIASREEVLAAYAKGVVFSWAFSAYFSRYIKQPNRSL